MDRSRDGVRETYNEIADHFAKTRGTPWPEVQTFLDDVPAGGLGLDLGCANGRHLQPLSTRTDAVIGIDISRSLLSLAAESGDADCLLQADATALPLADGTVQTAVYVATLHHLPTRTARRASLDELARVLAPDGHALISAWSTDHSRFDQTEGFDTTIDWTLPDGDTRERFYHIYDPDEFDADLDASALQVLDTELSSGNCYGRVAGDS